MADVLAASAVDVELCTDEELLDWSIAWAHCVKRWLWHARDTVCGRWLCEWSSIPMEADDGPGAITADGIKHILQARAALMQRCSFVICVGSDIQLEERTLKLGGYDGHCSRISWDDFLLPLACPGSTLLVASFRLPGEAAAGIAKLPAALDGKDVS